MLGDIAKADRVYIACGYTDMRRSIDGLAAIVQEKFNLSPFENSYSCSAAGKRTGSKHSTGKAMDLCCFTNALKTGNTNGLRIQRKPVP